MQDRSGHVHAHSCPGHPRDVQGEEERMHRTRADTNVLAHVLGICEMSKERERMHRTRVGTDMLAHTLCLCMRLSGRECAAHDMSEYLCALSCCRQRLV